MIEVWNQERGIWTYLFELDEIGSENDKGGNTNLITIIEEPFRKKLFKGVNDLSLRHFDNSKQVKPKGVETSVICPICKKGLMIMVKKEKHICQTHVCHIANKYLFRCSRFEDGCATSMYYYNRWLFC